MRCRGGPEELLLPAAAATTVLILQSLRLHGVLLAAADDLTKPVGLTPARWQLLSGVARAPHPAPVARVAREMGLARQSVQRVADQLVADGLLAFQDNPHHRRAALLVMTDQGTRAFEAIMDRQAPWVNELARGLALDDITAATDVLRRIEERLDAIGSAGEASTPEVRKRLR
jgi:DNA-binding MarR family transcriptional regulator